MSLLDLPAFGPGESVHVVVESPRGSNLKLKYDPQLQLFTLSRPLINGLTFPYDWGFVPSTQASDGDPFDAMVLWDQSSFSVSCCSAGSSARSPSSRTASIDRICENGTID